MFVNKVKNVIAEWDKTVQGVLLWENNALTVPTLHVG